MPFMGLEVFYVVIYQGFVAFDDQQILCVLVLCCRRKVKTAGDQRGFVDDHYFVMCDSMLVVYQDRHAGVVKESGRRIIGSGVTFVQDYLNLHATLSCINQRFCYSLRRKGVCLDKYFLSGCLDLLNNSFSCAAIWREEHLDCPRGWQWCRNSGGRKYNCQHLNKESHIHQLTWKQEYLLPVTAKGGQRQCTQTRS